MSTNVPDSMIRRSTSRRHGRRASAPTVAGDGRWRSDPALAEDLAGQADGRATDSVPTSFAISGFSNLPSRCFAACAPISIFGKLVVLTKMSDVREVLGRFDDFTLGEVIEPGMPWGAFLMTVDWSEQHARERGFSRV